MINLSEDDRTEVLLLMFKLYNSEPEDDFRYARGYYNSRLAIGKLFGINKREFNEFVRKIKNSDSVNYPKGGL